MDCEHEPANYEIRLDKNGKYQEISAQHLKRKNPIIHFIQTTAGRILFSILPILHSIKEKIFLLINFTLLHIRKYTKLKISFWIIIKKLFHHV